MNAEPIQYRCLVVDDEYMARLLLENYIQKLPELELVALCENALVAGPLIREQKIDLLFLDIQMPFLNGLEMIATLPYKPAVIFTTAYSEHAVDGYRLDAIDYLLKPFSFERFVQAVHKAIQFISTSRYPGTSQGLQVKDEVVADHFFVKSNGKLVKIKIQDIDYIEGLKEYVSIWCGTERIITLQSLRHLEELLPSPGFARVHKSYIVCTDKIQAIAGNQLEINKKPIPIGNTYKSELLRMLGLNED